jgi:hypothetical protein
VSRHLVVDHSGRAGVGGHRGEQGIVGALADRRAAAGPDGRKAEHAVVEHPRQQDSDGALAVRQCGGPEECVDRGAKRVLRRPLGQDDAVIDDEQVAVRDTHVDPA